MLRILSSRLTSIPRVVTTEHYNNAKCYENAFDSFSPAAMAIVFITPPQHGKCSAKRFSAPETVSRVSWMNNENSFYNLRGTHCGRLAVGLLIAAGGVIGGNVAAVGLSANRAQFLISIKCSTYSLIKFCCNAAQCIHTTSVRSCVYHAHTFPLSGTANIYHETSTFVTKFAFGRSSKDQGNVARRRW